MKYFAYGSNMSVSQMKNRGCANYKLIGPAKLNNHKFVYSGSSPNWEMKGTANIIEDNGSEVWGVLFDVTDHCLSRLDTYEHVPVRRNRKKVSVSDLESQKHDAIVYTLNTDLEFNNPSEEYHSQILSSAEEVGLPRDYIETLHKLKKTE